MRNDETSDFEHLSQASDPSLAREFLDFLRDNKKWWLLPILIATFLMVGAALLLPSPVAPFIYSLF